MNNILYVLVLIVILIFIRFITTKELFQNPFPVSDKTLFLRDKDGGKKVIAQFNNITKYMNIFTPINFKFLYFDKSNIIIPNVNYTDITISLFFKTLGNDNTDIISSQTGGYKLSLSNKLLILDAGGKQIKHKKAIKVNKLYHVAIAIDNNRVKIHCNGFQSEDTFNSLSETETINIGSDNFKGFIGKISIYNNYLSHQELCDNFKFCEDAEKKDTDSSCKFIPKGTSVEECASECMNNTNCDPEYCNSICQDCKNPNRCLWYTDPNVINETRIMRSKIPKAFNIKAIPLNESVVLRWKTESDKYKDLTGGSPITDYVIIVKKVEDNNNIQRISIHKEPSCKDCEYTVTGLTNQIAYDISIKAVNNFGIGPSSNIETVVPIGDKKIHEISDTILESDMDLLEKVSKEKDDTNNSCDKSSLQNYDNHILDKKYSNLYDYIENVL